MSISLKKKATIGVIWSATDQLGSQLIVFILGIILARILSPSDYGIIGIISVFTALSQVFIDGGFSSALIQCQKPSNSDYSTVFWTNLILSIIFYSLLYILAPVFETYFKTNGLSFLTRIISLNLIVSSFSSIQKTLLTKSLDFKKQTIVNLLSILISGIIGITFAFKGFGVWSLVFQSLSRNIVGSIGIWYLSEWRPDFKFSIDSFTTLFRFSSNVLVVNLINSISQNIYNLVIGKFFSKADLGFYNRADQFQKLPVNGIFSVIQKVSFPVLSQIQDNNEKLKFVYSNILRLSVMFLFPTMSVLSLISDPLITFLLTDKWLISAKILQVLCITGAFYPFHILNLNILYVKGRSDLSLKIEIIKQCLVFIMIIICFNWGVMGIVWGLVFLNIIFYYINSFYTKKLISYSISQQIKDIQFVLISNISLYSIFKLISTIISEPAISIIYIPVIYSIILFLLYYYFKRNEIITIKLLIHKLIN